MKNIDELIAKLESYEDYDGFNDDLVVALREQRDEIARERDANVAGRYAYSHYKERAERAETERNGLLKEQEIRVTALRKALAQRDAAIQLISDMEPYWKASTKGRIWDAATAGIMASIRSRIDAAMKEKP